jgi:hypothetical protein
MDGWMGGYVDESVCVCVCMCVCVRVCVSDYHYCLCIVGGVTRVRTGTLNCPLH